MHDYVKPALFLVLLVVASGLLGGVMAAGLAERHLAVSELLDPVAVIREFARTIRREMDFCREGHTI